MMVDLQLYRCAIALNCSGRTWTVLCFWRYGSCVCLFGPELSGHDRRWKEGSGRPNSTASLGGSRRTSLSLCLTRRVGAPTPQLRLHFVPHCLPPDNIYRIFTHFLSSCSLCRFVPGLRHLTVSRQNCARSEECPGTYSMRNDLTRIERASLWLADSMPPATGTTSTLILHRRPRWRPNLCRIKPDSRQASIRRRSPAFETSSTRSCTAMLQPRRQMWA